MIATLDVRIKSFLSAARRGIVDRKLGNITPKLHLLERHVVAQMRHFGTGFGLVGEHGAESIHAELNLLAATFDAVPKEMDLFFCLRQKSFKVEKKMPFHCHCVVYNCSIGKRFVSSLVRGDSPREYT